MVPQSVGPLERVSEALGEEPAPGERHGGFDGANTNIIGLDGRTFAIVEAGARPVELDYELDTVAHVDFDGTLPNGFTAHPKRDPQTGELYAAAYFWGLDHIQYIVVGTDGRVRKLEPISVKGSPMMHDMSLTERHAVFYDLPVTFNLEVGSGRRVASRTPGTTTTAPASVCCRAKAPTPTSAGSTSSPATCSTRSTPTTTATASCSTSSVTRACSIGTGSGRMRARLRCGAGRSTWRPGCVKEEQLERPGRGVPAGRRAGRVPAASVRLRRIAVDR